MISCKFENGNAAGLRHVVVGVIVVKDGKVLLEKRGTFRGKPILESGKWAIIGGFLDRDETLMECCRRETMEETGWTIKNLKLLRIIDDPHRPNDADRQNVAMTFIADAVSCNQHESEEVTDLAWFDLNDLPPKDQIAFDFAETLNLYKKYVEEKLPLPVMD